MVPCHRAFTVRVVFPYCHVGSGLPKKLRVGDLGSVFDNPARNDALEYIAGIVEQADQPIGQWELRRKPGTLYARIRLTLY